MKNCPGAKTHELDLESVYKRKHKYEGSKHIAELSNYVLGEYGVSISFRIIKITSEIESESEHS